MRDVKVLYAHAVRFVERDFVAGGTSGSTPDDHLTDFRERLPIEQAGLGKREEIARFVARDAAGIDGDVARPSHGSGIELAADERVRAGGVDVLTGFEPFA